MSKMALVAEFGVKPAMRDRFLALMTEHARAALAEEDGCLQFEVAVARDDPDRVLLWELYRDDDALAEHMGSAQLARTREAYAEMIESKRVTICRMA